jgi:hypothetical protein
MKPSKNDRIKNPKPPSYTWRKVIPNHINDIAILASFAGYAYFYPNTTIFHLGKEKTKAHIYSKTELVIENNLISYDDLEKNPFKWKAYFLEGDYTLIRNDCLEYNTSIEQIISLLTKVEDLGYVWNIGMHKTLSGYYCSILGDNIDILEEGYSINDCICKALLKFIKAYEFKKQMDEEK